MKPPEPPIFLAEQSYRRRRRRDVARVLPFLGVFLFLAPTLWDASGGTASVTVYVFTIWVMLIVIAAVVARPLRDDRGSEGTTEDREEG